MLHDAEIVNDFVAEAGERLDHMVDLALAAEEGDSDALRGLRGELHTLKGAAGFLGFDEFSELCHELEEYLLRDDTDAAERFDLLHDACDLLRDRVAAAQEACASRGALEPDPRGKRLRERLGSAA